MQERRLRLGDVLDDYCPREKRLSNHVIVALVGDEVRTTRCATCDFEHVYKEGKVPARRKKADPQAALYKTVLENITGRDAETRRALPPTSRPTCRRRWPMCRRRRLGSRPPPRRPSRCAGSAGGRAVLPSQSTNRDAKSPCTAIP